VEADVHDAVLAALGGARDELEQAVAVLAAGGVPNPLALGLGEGDRALLALVRAVTGDDVEIAATCPACGALNGAVLDRASVPAVSPRHALCGVGGGVREPTYADLVDLPADPDEAEAELLARCTVGAPARPPTVAELELVDDSLGGPLVLPCVECGSVVEVALDAQRVALERLAARADEVDVEVHLLAVAYHWDLSTIERLPSHRRHRLAQLVADGR
jgi:hypothetical protein